MLTLLFLSPPPPPGLLCVPLQVEVENGRVVEDMEGAAQANQRRMNADPLDVMLLNMGYRIMRGGGPEDSDDEENSEGQVQCRPS